MKNLTKIALGNSLRKLMAEKPLNKITIADITKDCGCNRMTFYYHFQDIYELLEWSLGQDAGKVLEGKLTLAGWQDGLREVFTQLQENKALVMNIHRNANRSVLENYLHNLAAEPLENFVREIAGAKLGAVGRGDGGKGGEAASVLDEEDAQFVVSFIEYGMLGLLRDWIDKGMKGDPEEIIARFDVLISALTK